MGARRTIRQRIRHGDSRDESSSATEAQVTFDTDSPEERRRHCSGCGSDFDSRLHRACPRCAVAACEAKMQKWTETERELLEAAEETIREVLSWSAMSPSQYRLRKAIISHREAKGI